MKRSKMLEIMEKAFIDSARVFMTTQDRMDHILTKMESKGVLPPGQEKDKVTFSRYSTGEPLGFNYEKYEWEPEDEKK